MTKATNTRSKQLFLDALEIALAERAAFLDTACAGDATLRARVEELLAANDRSADLEKLVTETTPAQPAASLAQVGDYELLEELGRGAVGTVYRAIQTSLGREVALKVLRAGSLASKNDVRRFQREAEAAAALDHPGIVPVFDIGEVDGHHYFTMKCVEGPSLDRVLERYAGQRRQAAQLVASVARAVHHAHRRGVLHRDLKPSNILLDADGEPHVADFGIARPLGEARITKTGMICGTPAYMSPEQARGDSDMTVSTDIWSLGCVLYELLAGAPPFGGGGVAQVLRRVQDEEPTRLNIDRDLETVIGACLAKDPLQRYPSAMALAEDLERWLDHMPITARPATRLERLRLLCRRSPVAAALSITVVVLLLVLGVVATAASLVLGKRLEETQEANRRANQRLRASYVSNARAERRSDLAGRRGVGLDLLVQAAAIEPGADLRDEAITTLTLPDLATIGRWHLDPVAGDPIGVDGDLDTMALGWDDGCVELRGARDGGLRVVLPATGGRALTAVFTHDGDRLWLRRQRERADAMPLLEVWDLAAQPPARMHTREVGSDSLARSRDGRLIAMPRHVDGVVEILDTDSFDVLHVLATDDRPAQCAFRPDGDALAMAIEAQHRVDVVAFDGARLASLELPAGVRSVSWSPDGELLLAGCFNQRGYIWKTSSWEQHAVLRGHEGELVQVEMLPGGLAFTVAWDGSTRLWDVETGTELLRSMSGFSAIDRTGRHAILRRDYTVEIVELQIGEVLQVLHAHQGKAPREVSESADGRMLATCGEASWILWGAQSGTRLATVPCKMVHSVGFDPLGGGVLTSGEDGLLRWPLRGDEVGEPEVLLEGNCRRSSITSDGSKICVVRGDTAVLLSRDGGQRDLGRHDGLDRVAFAPDGTRVAVGSWGGRGLHVWDTVTGENLAHLVPEAVSAMPTFSPDGTRLVISTFDQVLVLRAGSWEREREIAREGERRPGVPVAFSPDGALMAVGIAHERVRLVRVDGWRTVADLQPAKPHDLFQLRFVNGGRRLAIACPSQRLLIWDLERVWLELSERGLNVSGEPRWLPERSPDQSGR